MIYQSNFGLLYNMDCLAENWISRGLMCDRSKSRLEDRSFSISPGDYPSNMVQSYVRTYKESEND